MPSAATDGAWNGPASGRPKCSTSQLHGRRSGGAGGWNRRTPIWMSAGSQHVIQPDGQVHQLVECESGVPAVQLPTDVLAQTAPLVIDQGPVIPSRTPVRSSSPASGVRDVKSQSGPTSCFFPHIRRWPTPGPSLRIRKRGRYLARQQNTSHQIQPST